MTITYSIDRVSTTTADVAVPQLTQAGFSLVSTSRDVNSGVNESWYSIPTGDPLYPTTIVVRHAKNPKDKAGVRRLTLAINTWAREVDSVSGAETVNPISAAMTLQVPSATVEAADIAALIGNLYGLSFNSLTTKVPDTAVISGLLFGITPAF